MQRHCFGNRDNTALITHLGFQTQSQYDANGNPLKLLDANLVANSSWPHNTQSATVYRTFDELNRKTSELDANNGTTRFTYDLLGNLTSITDAANEKTTFVYDDLGRLMQTQDPLIETPTDKTDQVLLYDEAGNVLLTQDRSGRQRRYTYDALNRKTKVEYLQDNTQDSYTFDGFGDLTQVANDDVTYRYTYTARHEMKSKTDSRLNKSLIWRYDPVGDLQTKTDYQGTVTKYQYDSSNRLVAEQNPAYLQVSYHYDPAGRLIDRLLSNGAQTIYHYDGDGRLQELKNVSATGTVVSDVTYTRDAIGTLTKTVDSVSNKTVTYSYGTDGLYRLQSVNSTTASENRSYSYDAVGNRKTMVNAGTTYYYSYNPAGYSSAPIDNRLTTIRTGSGSGALYRQFQYDDSGRLLTKKDGTAAVIYQVSYNGKGRPSQITAGTQTDTYSYDPNDYRIDKADSQGNRLYHLEGEHLEATYSTSGVLQDSYLRGAIIDEIVNGYHYHSNQPGDRINYTFHHDAVNSVTALTDPSGATKETTTFDAFGMPLNLNLPGTGNRLLFTGREYDQDTGLYYYRARYYDPEIGRFLSEDPKGFDAGINFYAYANNNPVNGNDPSGQCPGCIAALVETAPEWGTAALAAGRVAWTAAAGFVSTNPGTVAGTIGGASGAAGYYTTTPNPTFQGGMFATGVGAAQGVLSVYAPGAGTFTQGAVISSLGDFATQGFNMAQGTQTSFNYGELGFSALGGGAATKLTGAFGPTWGEQAAAATIAWPVSTAAMAVGQRLGDTPAMTSGFSDFGSPSLNFPTFANSGSAAGGFVLYPNKPNTNQMQSVYAK